MNTTATAVTIPGDQYVARGVYATTRTNAADWADQFKALGGTECGVRPSWALGMTGTDVTVLIAGTPAAVEFVLDGLAA